MNPKPSHYLVTVQRRGGRRLHPWLCSGLLAVLIGHVSPGLSEPARELTGEQAATACLACHDLQPGPSEKIGPHLAGIVGRQSAAVAGYAYSPALQAAQLTFDRGTLAAWIADAETVVPGTWMLFDNPLSGTEIARLIDYLAKQATTLDETNTQHKTTAATKAFNDQ